MIINACSTVVGGPGDGKFQGLAPEPGREGQQQHLYQFDSGPASLDGSSMDDSNDLLMELEYIDAGFLNVKDEGGSPPEDAAWLQDSQQKGDPEPLPEDSNVLMEHSCEACKRSKKRCNRRRPCAICTSRGIVCVPQVRGPGRPPGSKVSTARTRSNGGTPSRSDSGMSSMGSSSSLNTLTKRSDSSSSLAAQPRDPEQSQLFAEAASYCRAVFVSAMQSDSLDLQKCTLLRNLWSRAGRRFLLDMTMGILEELEKVVGPYVPGVATENGKASSSMSVRTRRSVWLANGRSQSEQLKHPDPREGFGMWSLPEELQKLDDGVAMICCFMYSQDDFLVYTDDRFASTFMPREEILSKFDAQSVMPALLLSQIFHREDLSEAYTNLGSYWFSSKPSPYGGSREAAWFCRCVDRDGDSFLAWVRYRQLINQPEGYPGVGVFAIRPLGPSKFLLHRPDGRPAAIDAGDVVRAPPPQPEHQPSPEVASVPESHAPAVPPPPPLPLPASMSMDGNFRPLRRGESVIGNTTVSRPMLIRAHSVHEGLAARQTAAAAVTRPHSVGEITGMGGFAGRPRGRSLSVSIQQPLSHQQHYHQPPTPPHHHHHSQQVQQQPHTPTHTHAHTAAHQPMHVAHQFGHAIQQQQPQQVQQQQQPLQPQPAQPQQPQLNGHPTSQPMNGHYVGSVPPNPAVAPHMDAFSFHFQAPQAQTQTQPQPMHQSEPQPQHGNGHGNGISFETPMQRPVQSHFVPPEAKPPLSPFTNLMQTDTFFGSGSYHGHGGMTHLGQMQGHGDAHDGMEQDDELVYGVEG